MIEHRQNKDEFKVAALNSFLAIQMYKAKKVMKQNSTCLKCFFQSLNVRRKARNAINANFFISSSFHFLYTAYYQIRYIASFFSIKQDTYTV